VRGQRPWPARLADLSCSPSPSSTGPPLWPELPSVPSGAEATVAQEAGVSERGVNGALAGARRLTRGRSVVGGLRRRRTLLEGRRLGHGRWNGRSLASDACPRLHKVTGSRATSAALLSSLFLARRCGSMCQTRHEPRRQRGARGRIRKRADQAFGGGTSEAAHLRKANNMTVVEPDSCRPHIRGPWREERDPADDSPAQPRENNSGRIQSATTGLPPAWQPSLRANSQSSFSPFGRLRLYLSAAAILCCAAGCRASSGSSLDRSDFWISLFRS